MDINEIKQNINIVDVVSKYVNLEKKGVNHVAYCPFHEDDKASLVVSESKQYFKCFPCGESGDVIDFVMKISNCSTLEAIESISDDVANTVNFTPRKLDRTPKKEWLAVRPIDSDKPLFNHYKHGEPSNTWTYRNKHGDVIMYVCRFDMPDGSKEVLPYSYATDGETSQWRWMCMKKDRFLYGLDTLANNPNAQVLIVEGEKSADAAQSELDPSKVVVISWLGGANGIKNSDWSAIKDRNVILWPDNDTEATYGTKHPKSGELKPWHEQPGNSAMLEINSILKPNNTIRGMVKNTKDKPHKWDCADEEWNKDELRMYIKENLSPVPVIKKVTQDIPLKKVPEKKPVGNDYFRFLGYDKNEKSTLVYYFYSFAAKTVIKLSPPSMTGPNLLQLAKYSYWEMQFSAAKRKFDTEAAQEYLIDNSHRVGVFREDNIRGRGAWIDNEEIIVHIGSEIISKGKSHNLTEFNSKYVYEVGENIGIGGSEPLSATEGSYLLDKINWLNWERKSNSFLLAGWCVLAPFCGVLDWRPHIWVTGSAGSGKSWVMERIIKFLVGDSGVVVQGKTTEAGVRGLLQSDARPVLFDESDVEDQRDIDRIQSILTLARSASYSDGGGIVKGTQTGLSRTYRIRSMFAFASIGVQVTKQSDRSRFTILGLNAFEKENQDFKSFVEDWNTETSGNFVQRLQARTLNLLPIIIKNSKVLAEAAYVVVGNRRTGDQLGGMLAGAWSLKSDDLITYDQAIAWLETFDWSDEKGLENTKDEVQLMNVITSKVLKVESEYGSQVDRTIGELIIVASDNLPKNSRPTTQRDNPIHMKTATDRLKREGIFVQVDKVIFSNTAPPLKKIIQFTSWSKNHAKVLERMEGAIKEDSRVFSAGMKSRGISIPISFFIE